MKHTFSLRPAAMMLAGLLPFLAMPLPALADSIAPATFSATIPAIGGSVTVDKIVTVDAATTTSKVDVFFLADTTGSMGGAIGAVIGSAAGILAATSGLGDVNYAVGEYKDIGDAYEYRLNSGLTSSAAATTAGIGMWAAGGGGDTPEAQLQALSFAATGTPWRAGSTRIMVWFGDEPGHDPSGSAGVTLAGAIGSLTSFGIKVQAVDMGCLNCTGQAAAIAGATGGAYFAGISTATIVSTITAAITTAASTYTTVGLDLLGVPAGLSATAVCTGVCSGAFDRSVTRTFPFTVTFTGLAAGTYDFDVFGTVDGVAVATERDHIVVGAPEPGSSALMLAGLGMLGFGALRRRLNAAA